jgi:acylaminoacyl-peptidase
MAYLADRDSVVQVWTVPAAGGTPARLFAFGESIDEFSWFPDGHAIVFVAKEPKPAEQGARRNRPLVYTGTRVKSNEEGFLDGRRTHIWIADLTTGAVRQLTSGDADDTSPSVSADGRLVAFVSTRTANSWATGNLDVYLVPAAGGEPIHVSREAGAASNPRWSPDGRTLAWIEPKRALDYGDIYRVWTATRAGDTLAAAAPRDLSTAVGLSVGEGSYWEGGAPYPIWSPDGRSLYVSIETRARVHGYALDVRSGRPALLTGGDRMTEYLTPSGDGKRIIYGSTDGSHLSDVYVANADGSSPRQLTHLNDGWFDSVRVSPVERFDYRSADGTPVEGFAVKPLDYRPGVRYPTVLAIHGGPQWFFASSWSAFFQLLAARGYVVIYTNPRGSTSYGQPYSSIVRGDYGHLDYQDLMAGVDAAIARGWADSTRLFLTGYSYGGVMTNWMITQTNRFRAAASGAGLSDFSAAFGADDELEDWLGQWGTPWDSTARYRAQSPMSFIRNVRTPTLFFHGENDWRCPTAESERMYLALRLLGVDSKLAIFKGENHDFDHAASSYPERLRIVMDWFDAHGGRTGQ